MIESSFLTKDSAADEEGSENYYDDESVEVPDPASKIVTYTYDVLTQEEIFNLAHSINGNYQEIQNVCAALCALTTGGENIEKNTSNRNTTVIYPPPSKQEEASAVSNMFSVCVIIFIYSYKNRIKNNTITLFR